MNSFVLVGLLYYVVFGRFHLRYIIKHLKRQTFLNKNLHFVLVLYISLKTFDEVAYKKAAALYIYFLESRLNLKTCRSYFLVG